MTCRTATMVVTFVFVLWWQGADAFEDQAIRCEVCEKAIGWVWHQGDELRELCAREDTIERDPRCNIINLHKSGIEEMINNVCTDLPRTHRAIVSPRQFELRRHENPSHAEHENAAIVESCRSWLHEEHGIEELTRYIWGNLDAGKSTDVILRGLQIRFCSKACRSTRKQRARDRHDEGWEQPGQLEASQRSEDL